MADPIIAAAISSAVSAGISLYLGYVMGRKEINSVNDRLDACSKQRDTTFIENLGLTKKVQDLENELEAKAVNKKAVVTAVNSVLIACNVNAIEVAAIAKEIKDANDAVRKEKDKSFYEQAVRGMNAQQSPFRQDPYFPLFGSRTRNGS